MLAFVLCPGQRVLSQTGRLRVEPCGRMRCSVDLFQHANGNVSVYFRGIEPYMTEHGLDVADVSATFQH